MTSRILSFLLIVVCPTLFAQEAPQSSGAFADAIGKRIPQLLHDFNCPGAALAIIKNGEVILQEGYGIADKATNSPVTTSTGFNIGSISKTVAAWGVMNLVEEGKLDLDAPAETYLTRWHIPASEFDSNEVTIRRLLSHTAGLSLHGYPGWSPSDTLPTIEQSLNGINNGPGAVEIHFEPGSRYKYSGGGFTLLQLIIEEVTGQKFEDYMETEVLKPLGMHNSSYRIDDRIMAASASEYDSYGGEIDFELFTAQAAAGFHTTIEDFTRFALAGMYKNTEHESHGKVLSPETLHEMMTATPLANGRFGYGLGHMIESIPNSDLKLAGHRGANTGWQAIFNIDPETNDGFVMITNGGSGQAIYHPVFYDWMKWKESTAELEEWYNSKAPISASVKHALETGGNDLAASTYADLKTNHPDAYNFDEEQLNLLGYYFMNNNQPEKAEFVLKMNMEEFPASWNVYDSYGEALLMLGREKEAIGHYTTSVKMNPGNEGGVQILEDRGVDTQALFYHVTPEHLKMYEGTFMPTTTYDDSNGLWIFAFEVIDGELIGRDGDYVFKCHPVGPNAFVIGNGNSLVFDNSVPGTMTIVFDGEHGFKRM